MSEVIVMTWQPMESAWNKFSSSRGAGPDQLGLGAHADELDGLGHQRQRVAARVGDAAGKDGNVAGAAAAQHLGDAARSGRAS